MFRKMTILAALAFFSSQSFAHEGDKLAPIDPALTAEQVIELAAKELPELVKSNKVAAAWSDVYPESIGAYGKGRDVTWRVSYKNPDGQVDGGKRLFLIFSDKGNFVGFNNTGKIKDTAKVVSGGKAKAK